MRIPYVPWSERERLVEVRTQIQDSGMGRRLRIDLWNALHDEVLARFPDGVVYSLFRDLWAEVLSRPIDEYRADEGRGAVRQTVLDGDWRDACNVLAYVAEHLPVILGPDPGEDFLARANAAFERGKFAWRFVGRDLVRWIGETEIKAVEVAWQDSQPFPEVQKQLRTAIAEFSARDSPNYAQAAKEAISAVETLCRHILGDENITLGDALREMRKRGKPGVHPALLENFEKLWGYASDKGLVRHGAKPGDPSMVTVEEAQLMLVMCHAIVSFLVARGREEGLL